MADVEQKEHMTSYARDGAGNLPTSASSPSTRRESQFTLTTSGASGRKSDAQQAQELLEAMKVNNEVQQRAMQSPDEAPHRRRSSVASSLFGSFKDKVLRRGSSAG